MANYTYQRTVDANGGVAQSGLTAAIVLTAMAAGSRVYIPVKLSSDSRTIVSVVSTDGTTFSVVDGDNDASNNAFFVLRCQALLGAAPTVTVTFDNTASDVYLWGDEYANLDAAAAVDQHNTSGVFGTTSTSVAVTNTVQPGILYCAAMSENGANNRPLTTPAGMTRRADLPIGANASMRGSFDLRLTATALQTVTVAVTGGNSGIVAVLLDDPEASSGAAYTLAADPGAFSLAGAIANFIRNSLHPPLFVYGL